MMHRVRLTGLCLATALCSTGLAAQGEDREGAPPLDLVLRLLGAESARILEGEVPAEVAANLYLPPGAKIQGTLIRSYGTMVAIDVSSAPELVLEQLERDYAAADWLPMYRGQPEGGFFPHEQHSAATYCRGRDWVSFTARESEPGETRLRVSLRDLERHACDLRMHEGFVDGGDLPVLVAPAGTEVEDMGGGGGIDNREVEARLRSNAPADALVAHYAQQIEAAG